jgi:membrane associated rhomboid family serine protease
MKTVQRRSAFSYIPGYSNNAVLQIIMVCGVAFVLFHGTRVILMMIGTPEAAFYDSAMPNLALFTAGLFKTKFWTVLTYSFLHSGFWTLVSNMLWLYCFGNLVQVLIGHRHVFPIYIYSAVIGGLFFILSQLIPGSAFHTLYYATGAQAAIMGMAIASVTLAPGYKFYIGDRLRIPLALIVGLFVVLMLMYTGLQLPLVFLLLGGALPGFVYIRLLNSGYRPGNWMHVLVRRVEGIVTPGEDRKMHSGPKRSEVKKLSSKKDISQKRIDEILDKIGQRGYNSLTSEEKDILFRASNDKN